MIAIPMTVACDSVSIKMGVAGSQVALPVQIGADYELIEAEEYTGTYEVTPGLTAQSLDTDGKFMTSDVTIYEIPITRTSNPQGGLTVLIG